MQQRFFCTIPAPGLAISEMPAGAEERPFFLGTPSGYEGYQQM
jgi:hypothetical protein